MLLSEFFTRFYACMASKSDHEKVLPLRLASKTIVLKVGSCGTFPKKLWTSTYNDPSYGDPQNGPMFWGTLNPKRSTLNPKS